MKCFTPQISWHNRDPILSVDIQNRLLSCSTSLVSYRLATSGNDSHVIVWKASINEKPINCNNKSSNISLECLADLTKHQRSVNVIRFSPNVLDNYLAAGDDDCVIYVWKLCTDNNDIDLKSPQKEIKKSFCVKHNENSDEDECEIIEERNSPPFIVRVVKPEGEGLETDVIAKEVWKPYKILRGHLQDVSDICWSPDGQKIVSGSVDNMVIVWDFHKKERLHKIVNEHKGFVQGVCWDPFGKYLATLSADRNLRIINTNNGRTVYRVHKMVSEDGKSSRLFYDDTLRSFCRRLTFTPGGEFLITPSGILELNEDNDSSDESNKYINTTYVFERNSLNKPSFYLPSKKYTIAVSCCPQLFQLQENLENQFKFGYRIVFAVATQDSVIFYDSQQVLPFAQVSQIHYLRLTDISWSCDGRMLIVTSTDGFATFITFNDNELGIPYNGPKFNFEEIESNSPINTKNNTKINITVESTPEPDKQIKKISTPAITTFFKPSNETPVISSPNEAIPVSSKSPKNDVKNIIEANLLSPKSSSSIVSKSQITPETEKPIKKSSIKSFFKPKSETPNNSNTKAGIEELSNGKKRKEVVVDLTEDSEDGEQVNNPSKRPNYSRSPLRHSNHVNLETASLSTLIAPQNCKVKEHSVRKLVDQFEEVSMDESSHLNYDHLNDTNNDMKINSLSTETNVETKCETIESLDLQTSQPITSSQPKQPRRIQFQTLGK